MSNRAFPIVAALAAACLEDREAVCVGGVTEEGCARDAVEGEGESEREPAMPPGGADTWDGPLPETCPQAPGGDGGLDVLFVIDNSNSMQQEQDALAAQAAAALGVLIDASADPDLHVGVISTDLGAARYSILTCPSPGGDRGALLCRGDSEFCLPERDFLTVRRGGEAGDLSGGNLPDTDGDGDRDLDDVAATFGRMVDLGVGGCGFEQPLEAMALALSAPLACDGGLNEGFLREGAALAVVILTDEDDCSARDGDLFNPSDASLGPLQSYRCFSHGIAWDEGAPPGTLSGCRPLRDDAGEPSPWLWSPRRYVAFLRGLKPEGRAVLLVLAGDYAPGDRVTVGVDRMDNLDLLPSCRGDLGQATPAIRLRAVTDALGDRGLFRSVCDADFPEAFELLASRLPE